MNVDEALDKLIERTDNVSPTDSDYDNRRARYLDALVIVLTHVTYERGWAWRLRSASLTVDAGDGFVAVPDDFGDIPTDGGLFLASTGAELDFMEPKVLLMGRERPGNVTNDPDVYSLFGQEDALSSEARDLIQVPMNSAAVNLKLWYGAAVPELGETTDTNGNLNFIPARWHQSVLIAGARSVGRESLADGRAAPAFTMDPLFQAGLRTMIRAERPSAKGPRQFPRG